MDVCTFPISFYLVQKIQDGFWGASTRSFRCTDAKGKTMQHYPIKNTSGFCVHEPSQAVGVLDTGGQFYYIDAKQKAMKRMNIKNKKESSRPVLLNDKMFWVQWDGVIRSFDFRTLELSTVATIPASKDTFVPDCAIDTVNNRLCMMFTYPPRKREYFAEVSLLSGKVQIIELPFCFPKSLYRIQLWKGDYLCLHSFKDLIWISSRDFSVQKKIALPVKVAISGFTCDEKNNYVYAWDSSFVVRVDMQSFETEVVWQDNIKDIMILDVTIAETGDVCIGTGKSVIVLQV